MRLKNIIVSNNDTNVLSVDFEESLDGSGELNTTVTDTSGNNNHGAINTNNERYLFHFWLYTIPTSTVYVEKGLAPVDITLGKVEGVYGETILNTDTYLGSEISVGDYIRPKTGLNIYDNNNESYFVYKVASIDASTVTLENKYREPIDGYLDWEKVTPVKSFSSTDYQYMGGSKIVGGWDFDTDTQVQKTFFDTPETGVKYLFSRVNTSFENSNANNINFDGIQTHRGLSIDISGVNDGNLFINNCKLGMTYSRFSNTTVKNSTGNRYGYTSFNSILLTSRFTTIDNFLGVDSSYGIYSATGATDSSIKINRVRFSHMSSVAILYAGSAVLTITGNTYPFDDVVSYASSSVENNLVIIKPTIDGENVHNVGTPYKFSVTDSNSILKYKYKLNQVDYSNELFINSEVTLENVTAGTNSIKVVGKYANGFWADHVSSSYFDSSTTYYSELEFFTRDLKTLKYTKLLINLLPQGDIWRIEDTNVFARLLSALASEFARFDDFYQKNKQELLAHKTTDYLEEWEAEVGLPGDCRVLASTIDRRRQAVLAKLRGRGGNTASINYIKNFFKSFGYDIEIVEYPNCEFGVADSPFLWEIWSDYDGIEDDFARVSAGSGDSGLIFCDSPLAVWGNQLFDCITNKVKPVHTQVRFKTNP